MNTTWAYHKCGETLKGEIQSYAQKKLARIERLLSRFRPSLKELAITVHHHRQASGDHFEARAVLHLPTGTLAAQELSDTWRGAIDLVLDELANQVRRHKERLRSDWVYSRPFVTGPWTPWRSWTQHLAGSRFTHLVFGRPWCIIEADL